MSVDDLPREADVLGHALRNWFEDLGPTPGEDEVSQPWMREPATPVFGVLDVDTMPLVDSRSVAAGVFDDRGELLAATGAFLEGRCGDLVDSAQLARVAAGSDAVYLTASRSTGDRMATGAIAYAPGHRTSTWRLPPEIHEAASAQRGSVVVVTTMIDGQLGPLRDACYAYGLTGLQTRVALETIRVGAIKEAASNLGLSYQTAREALSEAMKRVGVDRLPGLVTHLTTLAFGVLPGRGASADILVDVWGLSERQIAIAGMVAQGASREQAAHLHGLTLSVVKKELDAAYSLLQVSSSAALARKIVEARALSWLTASTAGGLGFIQDQSEPLRFALRPDMSRIAISDYGPASGRPVLVLHSSMTTRIVSRKLLRALQQAGYRPISIDRPGFGLTDPLADPATPEDPFSAATGDVARVLSLLKIRKVDIVSRGAAQFLVALAKAMPDAIGRVALVNPGPPYRYSGRSLGPLGVIKDAFIRNPATIGWIAPFLAVQLTPRRLARMMVQWTRGSPPDELATQDPEIVADFFRSVRMFATGRYSGFLAEQLAISARGVQAPFGGAERWRILLGASDVLYEPEVVLEYWRRLLPGARFEVVADGGRFLAMTHSQLVVAALEEDPT